MAIKKKPIILGIVLFTVLFALAAYLYVNSIISTKFDIKETVYIEIDDSKNYQSIIQQMKDVAHINSTANFEKLAKFLEYPDNIKSGRYAIAPDMDILQAVRLLKSGHQTPVKLRFNNIRTKDDLVERISGQLMISKEALMTALNKSTICAKYEFTPETIVTMFIPNTYEVYWNVSLDKFLDRMNTEHKKFWNEERFKKLETIGISPVEASVLASIVEEECYFPDEYPIVAGLYINRLKRGMMLQADPTVKFAIGDFTLRRILNKHLEVDSPYNTYRNAGLPPAPIRVPSIKAIDSVLNYKSHNYLYMCAKEDFSSRHNFAVTHAEHQRNASKYQAALNQRKIYN